MVSSGKQKFWPCWKQPAVLKDSRKPQNGCIDPLDLSMGDNGCRGVFPQKYNRWFQGLSVLDRHQQIWCSFSRTQKTQNGFLWLRFLILRATSLLNRNKHIWKLFFWFLQVSIGFNVFAARHPYPPYRYSGFPGIILRAILKTFSQAFHYIMKPIQR